MQYVPVLNPCRHVLQQPVMPDIVKVAAQIKIENACLPLANRFSHKLYGGMCCFLGAISKRSRLKIRLEDGLKYELERPLHHPVPDGRHGHVKLHFGPISLWDWLR